MTRTSSSQIWTLARETFFQSVVSPVAYVVAFFFYAFVGAILGKDFFQFGNASMEGVFQIAPWSLWFVIPALTMGLISEELRSGTFEQLSTLPLRDWEIVLGKYLGFAMLAFVLIGGLSFFAVLVSALSGHPQGIDWGGAIGSLAALYCMSLCYGAMGLYASSLSKNQVVSLIIGLIFCTMFFLAGQFYESMSRFWAAVADLLGLTSHVTTLSRGVWDLRDFFYFVSLSSVFLYLTAQRLNSRRF